MIGWVFSQDEVFSRASRKGEMIMSSEMLDMLIFGGDVVTPKGVIKASVGVRGEKIVSITDSSFSKPPAKEVVNASGKLVLPGAIDVHVHFKTFNAQVDDLATLSTSAAHGGVTTIVSFISHRTDLPEDGLGPFRGMRLVDYLGLFIEEGRQGSVIDFGFHGRIIDDWDVIAQIPELHKMGVLSFKVNCGYRKRGRSFNDDYMIGTMESVAALGGLLQIHAENGILIDYLENKLIRDNRINPVDFYDSRPGVAEADAVARDIKFAKFTNCPIYIVHLSSWEALEEIKNARSRGQYVFAETCPQYLLLTNKLMEKYGGLAKIGPPLRGEKDNESMWEGIAQGYIQVVGTDHAAYTKAAKASGGDNIFKVPFGCPGTETMLRLMYNEGVLKGRITLERLVELISENPARIFGLYPRKGVIQIGADADIVILNPNQDFVIRAEGQHSKADYSLYEGMKGKGVPEISILRGKVLLKDGEIRQTGGYGKFIPRPVEGWPGYPF